LLDWLIESEITPPIAARVVWVYRLWLWLLWLDASAHNVVVGHCLT
jgi:hypothetical protein